MCGEREAVGGAAVIDRNKALSLENERLKMELLEREGALSRVQHSVSTLQHRLALLASTEPRPHAQLDAVNQVIRKIAREVGLFHV